MSNLNKALLIGRLTKDPEMRYTPSGTAVTNFSIATNRWSSGPEGERKEFTDYHNIVAYNIGKRNLAEIVAQYTRKGMTSHGDNARAPARVACPPPGKWEPPRKLLLAGQIVEDSVVETAYHPLRAARTLLTDAADFFQTAGADLFCKRLGLWRLGPPPPLGCAAPEES